MTLKLWLYKGVADYCVRETKEGAVVGHWLFSWRIISNKMGPPFRQTYVSPTRWLRALYMPQLRSLVGETSVRQGAGPSWPAGGVTGPFGPRFRVFLVGFV